MAYQAKREQCYTSGVVHNSQSLQIYLVPLKGGESPKQLTTGKQGATNSPVFNLQGTKVAWTEMGEDGNEADRYSYTVISVNIA